MSTSDPKTSRERTGAAHLLRLSALRKRIQDDGINPSLLVVEDERMDAHFIETPLRRLFGHEMRIDIAPTVKAMTDALKQRRYDVVLLDDRMDGGVTTETTLPQIRARLAKVPVIVVSRLLTRVRVAELARLGCHAVHGKEDLDSTILGEAILNALGHKI
jgi:DNA-binding NtrC family response regulator